MSYAVLYCLLCWIFRLLKGKMLILSSEASDVGRALPRHYNKERSLKEYGSPAANNPQDYLRV